MGDMGGTMAAAMGVGFLRAATVGTAASVVALVARAGRVAAMGVGVGVGKGAAGDTEDGKTRVQVEMKGVVQCRRETLNGSSVIGVVSAL